MEFEPEVTPDLYFLGVQLADAYSKGTTAQRAQLNVCAIAVAMPKLGIDLSGLYPEDGFHEFSRRHVGAIVDKFGAPNLTRVAMQAFQFINDELYPAEVDPSEGQAGE